MRHAVGACLLPLLAWLVPNWRLLSLMGCGSAVLMLFVLPQIPESPRCEIMCRCRHPGTYFAKLRLLTFSTVLVHFLLPQAPESPRCDTIVRTVKFRDLVRNAG